jgi:hypothetical protein
MRDQLLGVLFLTNDVVFDKLSKSKSVGSVLKLEIETLSILLFTNICALLGRVMF